ncbi:HNH endonuclease [Cellulomonas soli]|uniref:HNH endonuclease n=1 Tax=Cellulomonas soli TaxID=931535 RepID=UPI003F84AECA
MSAAWGGRKVTNARAYWRARLPLPCRRCGRPVYADSRWHVGHVQDRVLGGGDSVSNQWPEHERCNTSAGGKLGAAITNARRAPVPDGRDRGLRGV